MYTTITASSRFKIYVAMALAALLMTMLAVTLATSQAQATTTTTIASDGDDNSIPQQQGEAATPAAHKTPEACPADDDVARVVDRGHYALFDVWWNDDEGELTNNVCPPRVTYVPGDEEEETDPRTDRAPSSINITADPPTIIHIPNSAKVTLSESNYPKDKYGDVWDADDAENPNGDGDRMVWVLPACPPNGDPSEVGLCVSYSAALLNPADWNGNIEYIVTHVHQVDIDKQDRRYVLAYDVPEAGATGEPVLRWDSSDQETDKVYVAPGEYDRPMWFFPSRGAYEFQVYIRGNPNDTISNDDSVTSDLREYIVHVGAEADLSATVNVTPQNPSPTNEVTITVTASNAAGKDAAPETKVEVSLPEGLTYSSHEAPTGTTYNSTTGDWTWNEDVSLASGASKTLTVKATVDAETHGETLTARATISATETVTTNSGNHEVPVPDPDPTNNMDAGTVTVASSANVDPMFVTTRSVPENSSAGTLVGGQIAVKEPNTGDTLTFSLTGEGADNFTASSVSGGGQIAVANGANLDYETKQSYDLTLGVSDGKDEAGNDDSTIDNTIAVVIEINNVIELSLSVSDTTPSFGEAVTWTASLGTLPADATNVVYHWSMFVNDGTPDQTWEDRRETGAQLTWTDTGPYFADVKMRVSASYTDGNGNSHSVPRVESEWVKWR